MLISQVKFWINFPDHTLTAPIYNSAICIPFVRGGDQADHPQQSVTILSCLVNPILAPRHHYHYVLDIIRIIDHAMLKFG